MLFFSRTAIMGEKTHKGVFTMSNIWHDISPSRIQPEDFVVAVIEILRA